MKTWPITCSWCGIEVARAIMPNSHGICPPCGDRMIQDAKELKESREKKEEKKK